MRLWHKDLIPLLPTMQLKGQWRECCLIAKALHDGNLNHILVNRVKDYPIEHFVAYSYLVANEMYRRGYKVNKSRFDQYFHLQKSVDEKLFGDWHNERYLRQCIYNLEEKAICGGIPTDEWQKIYDVYGERFDLWDGKEGDKQWN